MTKSSVIVIMILAMVLPFNKRAMAQSLEVPVTSNGILKRNYPGGRDDTDLTVQPKKRITKKEVAERADEVDEEDFDQGDAANGFGE